MSDNDIIIQGIPRKWDQEFEQSGHNPMNSNLEELIKHFKWMESLDYLDAKHAAKKAKKGNSIKKHDKTPPNKKHKTH
jgi:hypothetical protein